MAEIKLKLKDAVEKYRSTFPDSERPSQVKIAVEAGIDPATLSRYLNNKVERTELAVVAKLCIYLGIDDMNEIFELQKE